MQFLSHVDSEHSECRVLSSLTRSFILAFFTDILRTPRFPDFHSRLKKVLEINPVSLLESPSPGSGDSWDTQLLTEATDETALIIIVTARGYSENEIMNKPHHHSLARKQ